jgi:hypothetical protein
LNAKLALKLRQSLQVSRHLVTIAAESDQAITLTTTPDVSRVDVLDLVPFVWEDRDDEVTKGYSRRVVLAIGVAVLLRKRQPCGPLAFDPVRC